MFTMLLVAFLGLPPGVQPADTHAHPSETTFCADFVSDSCKTGEHALLGPSGGGFDPSEAHLDCRTCVFGLPCHRGCNIQQTEDEETQLAYEEARQAAAIGDIESLVALASRLDRYIVTNNKRGTIQLLSCDRSIVVSNLELRAGYHVIASGLTYLQTTDAPAEAPLQD